MDRYQYLLIMAACAAITLPLEFVFRARVYRRPRRLVRAMWLPVAAFVVWDAIAIAMMSEVGVELPPAPPLLPPHKRLHLEGFDNA